jgi:uncharacterized damage-inducible protein DinB
MSTEIAFWVDQFYRAWRHDPWHGPPLAELVRGVPAELAAQRPPGEAHSIWELVLHLAAWQREVVERLTGKEPGEPRMGEWPEVPSPPNEAAWGAAIDELEASFGALQTQLALLPTGDLDRRVGKAEDRALATGSTVRQTLSGLLQHHAYHGGQIALLRRVLGG